MLITCIVIVEKAEHLHLVEIKMRKNIGEADAKTLANFQAAGKELRRWLVSCFEHEIKIDKNVMAISWWKMHSFL